MDSITQAEFHKRFDEYIKGKKPEGDPVRWYVNELMKFDKELQKQDITVRAGFHVNEVGERIDE